MNSLFPVLLLLAAVLVVIVAVASVLTKHSRRGDEYPYTRCTALFSPAERSFLGVLEQAVGLEYRVFGKVRVADIIEPRSGLNGSARQAAFNRTSAKHFDFILCEPTDLSVACAIELNDASHQIRSRQERDAFLTAVCKAASLPLLQIPAQRTYAVHELREQVMSAVGHGNKGPLPSEPAVLDAKASPPNCPHCSAMMVRRSAQSGPNAGRSFWGCSRFPKCRGIIPANA